MNYFKEKWLTDILFPTLIILARNQSILSIIDNEISLEYLSRYLKWALSNEDIVRIPEDDWEYSMGSSSMRSPSIGSTNSS